MQYEQYASMWFGTQPLFIVGGGGLVPCLTLKSRSRRALSFRDPSLSAASSATWLFHCSSFCCEGFKTTEHAGDEEVNAFTKVNMEVNAATNCC